MGADASTTRKVHVQNTKSPFSFMTIACRIAFEMEGDAPAKSVRRVFDILYANNHALLRRHRLFL